MAGLIYHRITIVLTTITHNADARLAGTLSYVMQDRALNPREERHLQGGTLIGHYQIKKESAA